MPKSSRRMFFALWPDEDLRLSLHSLAAELSAGRGRATHVSDLHATLVFLGDVPEQGLACIEQAAREVAAPVFDLTLNRVGYWPRPRILWCGPGEAPQVLIALVADLQRNLQGCGFTPERRPYAAHVTLARKLGKAQPRALERPLNWRVREFVLAESRPGGEAPHYRVVGIWPLGAAGP